MPDAAAALPLMPPRHAEADTPMILRYAMLTLMPCRHVARRRWRLPLMLTPCCRAALRQCRGR